MNLKNELFLLIYFYIFILYILKMGQYYKIIILADKKYKKEIIRMWMCTYLYNNGSKLMEHSYIGNNFIQALEYLISPKGMFYMSRIVWAGDYADSEEDEDYNLYRLTDDNENIQSPKSVDTECYRYIVNHTKNLYVDKKRNIDNKEKNNYLIVHPLPLLVSEGNGRGGGDYNGKNAELCGTWARDTISVEETIPDNFEELVCDFCE
jgi:hypothetical protein